MLRCSLGVSSMDGIRNESVGAAVQAETVWACAKEGWWKYWTKDDEYGATGQGKEKTAEFHGCSDRGYGGQGEMEVNDLLWQPLKAVAGKKKQPIKMR